MISYPNVKINLGLHIMRKRPDGYHDLETLFVPFFGITDILEIELSRTGEDSISIQGGSWDPMTDLCWKALQMLKADFELPAFEIRLTKRAPVGAGLGSGSSDAVFTLRMISELAGLGLDDAALVSYAARLGSDCAFFVYNRPMFGEGRGEILSPFDMDLSAYELKVEVPAGVAVSTREAYAGVTPRESAGASAAAAADLREILARPVEQWKDTLENDFERSVFAAHPEIAALKQDFYVRGAVYAAMSGSGSSVFALFRK